jgi:hypothetical protein
VIGVRATPWLDESERPGPGTIGVIEACVDSARNPGKILDMSERDDFSEKVKKAIALRAGYRCSFPSCDQLTVGPSEESPTAVAMVGIAAHISAAAPGLGARRYDPTMTSEERSSIQNAIWLCGNHATLIDRDEIKYTRKLIADWRIAHEKRIKDELETGKRNAINLPDLIAIGPHVVAVGELAGVQGSTWRLHLTHFVVGDTAALTAFGEELDRLPKMDRFILVNAEGDGRVVSASLGWTRSNDAIQVDLQVEPRFPRIKAQELGADLELVDGDLAPSFGIVSGLKRLPQHLEIVMGMLKGREWINGDFGSRISEYFALYGGTTWFSRMVKLEAIRLAAIPFEDSVLKIENTPFRCVERVRELQIGVPIPINCRLPIGVALDVGGVGLWKHDLKVFVSETSQFRNAEH